MSVTQWARCEFGPDRFSAERRKEIVGLLTDAGLTVREIAEAARTPGDRHTRPAGTWCFK